MVGNNNQSQYFSLAIEYCHPATLN